MIRPRFEPKNSNFVPKNTQNEIYLKSRIIYWFFFSVTNSVILVPLAFWSLQCDNNCGIFRSKWTISTKRRPAYLFFTISSLEGKGIQEIILHESLYYSLLNREEGLNDTAISASPRKGSPSLVPLALALLNVLIIS